MNSYLKYLLEQEDESSWGEVFLAMENTYKNILKGLVKQEDEKIFWENVTEMKNKRGFFEFKKNLEVYKNEQKSFSEQIGKKMAPL